MSMTRAPGRRIPTVPQWDVRRESEGEKHGEANKAWSDADAAAIHL